MRPTNGSTVPRPRVVLKPQAFGALRAAAGASRTSERGGILVGYRHGLDVVVEDALTVPDPRANRTTYVRRPQPAADVLATYLRRADPLVGYVGEWHTHPEPQPPSGVDHQAMRLMTLRNQDSTALVVAALKPDGSVELHGVLSVPDAWTHDLASRHLEATVTVE